VLKSIRGSATGPRGCPCFASTGTFAASESTISVGKTLISVGKASKGVRCDVLKYGGNKISETNRPLIADKARPPASRRSSSIEGH